MAAAHILNLSCFVAHRTFHFDCTWVLGRMCLDFEPSRPGFPFPGILEIAPAYSGLVGLVPGPELADNLEGSLQLRFLLVSVRSQSQYYCSVKVSHLISWIVSNTRVLAFLSLLTLYLTDRTHRAKQNTCRHCELPTTWIFVL